jgi:hypothetical protein
MDNFDIFSKPFLFKVSKNNDKKKTHLGGLVTLIVLGLALAYFVDICIIFFKRSTPPIIH